MLIYMNRANMSFYVCVDEALSCDQMWLGAFCLPVCKNRAANINEQTLAWYLRNKKKKLQIALLFLWRGIWITEQKNKCEELGISPVPSVFAPRSDLLRPADGAVSSSVIHPVGGCLSRVGEALPINRLCMSSLHIWGMHGMEGVPKKPWVYIIMFCITAWC